MDAMGATGTCTTCYAHIGVGRKDMQPLIRVGFGTRASCGPPHSHPDSVRLCSVLLCIVDMGCCALCCCVLLCLAVFVVCLHCLVVVFIWFDLFYFGLLCYVLCVLACFDN